MSSRSAAAADAAAARNNKILVVTNAVTCLAWIRVLSVFIAHGDVLQPAASSCREVLRPAVFWALGCSSLELVTSLLGCTRSNPLQVVLFCSVRAGIEVLVAPLLPSCSAWQHVATVLLWTSGEIVRFGCFAADGLLAGVPILKSIRYTVGPVLFPLGALGEVLMVLAAAAAGRGHSLLMYGAAALWPVGFYPLYAQLLKQRRKHFRQATGKKEIKSV